MFDNASTAGAVQTIADATPEPLRIELGPDVVLPAQFHTGFRHDASIRPELRLMLAVLEEAVGDFQRHVAADTREGQRHFQEAEAWFASSDADWPFSFLNICEALQFEPDYVRAGLARWREAQRARVASGQPVIRLQLRRVAGMRSKASGRTALGRVRSRW